MKGERDMPYFVLGTLVGIVTSLASDVSQRR